MTQAGLPCRRQQLTDLLPDRELSFSAFGHQSPTRRLSFAGGGDRPAIDGRTEFDPPCGWGQPKTLDATRGTTSPAPPRHPGLQHAGTRIARDRRGTTPGVAPAIRAARDVARTTQPCGLIHRSAARHAPRLRGASTGVHTPRASRCVLCRRQRRDACHTASETHPTICLPQCTAITEL